MTTIRQHLQSTRGNYSDAERRKWILDCAEKLQVNRTTVGNVATQLWPCGRWNSNTPSNQQSTNQSKQLIQSTKCVSGNMRSLSEDDIRRKHDNAFKIREAAGKIMEGEYILENDFISNLNIRGGYKYIVERPEFEKYRGRASGDCWYWSHPNSIMKLKNEGILQ